jgi:hypothetical protein
VIYLTGVTASGYEARLIAAGMGLMVQPRSGYDRYIERWPFYAADNGCFTGRWRADHWERWLSGLSPNRCLFAVAPDVYPDARASLGRGLEYVELVRSLGFPVAIVAQNQAEELEWPWEEFDALFIGGTMTGKPRHEWKESDAAASLVAEARRRGKWVHMGRVNGWPRMRRAEAMGCHSCDGTTIKYAPFLNVPRISRAVDIASFDVPLYGPRELVAHPFHRSVLFGEIGASRGDVIPPGGMQIPED